MSKSSLFASSAPETGQITAAITICQKASQGMEKVAYKYEPYTKTMSRSGHIRSPNENVAQVSSNTRFMAQDAEFDDDWPEERSTSGQNSPN